MSQPIRIANRTSVAHAAAGPRDGGPSPQELLAAVPQQPPFRFVDAIEAVDAERIVGRYRFPEDADFYQGHFPTQPVTPGVLLIETMAQCAVVPHALYLMARGRGSEAFSDMLPIFTRADVHFTGRVPPGSEVIVTGVKEHFRFRQLRSRVVMHLDGEEVCAGTLYGMAIPAEGASPGPQQAA